MMITQPVFFVNSFLSDCPKPALSRRMKGEKAMFSIQHIIWIVISVAAIVLGIIVLKKKKPTLRQVLTSACVVCVASELVKVFSCLQLVPSADGSILYPYLELQHLPLHLCSIQLVFIFWCRFGRGTAAENRTKQFLLQFMYPTCAIGAPFAIILPSIFNTTISVSQAFTHPIAYQTFLYHAMLIVLGMYIPMSGEVKFSWKTYAKTMGFLGLIFFAQIYLNSLFADVTYVNGKLSAVNYVTNFFFVFKTPIGIALNTKLAWMVYVAILVALAFLLVWLLYLPLRKTRCWDNPASSQVREQS